MSDREERSDRHLVMTGGSCLASRVIGHIATRISGNLRGVRCRDVRRLDCFSSLRQNKNMFARVRVRC